MSGIKRTGGGDRGQAYTLEGFIGSMVVLMAVLFALQSIVITPTTGGAADRTVQSQVQQETMDALSIAAEGQGENGTLSYMIRYWNHSEKRFHGANATDSGDTYGAQSFNREAFVLGQILSDRYTETGSYYNVELVYQNGSTTTDNVTMVNQGSPPESAITASRTVTLYDDDELTAPNSRNKGITLREAYKNDGYPIPPAGTDPENPVYNVVEVRVIVW
ncbi:hypothetical protein ACERIM_01255 [Natrinema sp. H-ect1]|uniref:DUF7288 family protein n=1 Tax=Natrinema sp. H-ect1 TaxID=3242700 RepID=UPI00359D22A8